MGESTTVSLPLGSYREHYIEASLCICKILESISLCRNTGAAAAISKLQSSCRQSKVIINFMGQCLLSSINLYSYLGFPSH